MLHRVTSDWSVDLLSGFKPISKARIPLYLSLLVLTLVSACSVGDFVGAYFNTYYNAEKLFSETEDEILNPRTGKPPDQSSSKPFAVEAASKTKFTSVIEKCSKLLQYHPESGLVQGALLMIGKSYYYQNENQKAERKFFELLEGYPDGKYKFEAKLLLARSYYRMNETSKATRIATELTDSAAIEGENDVATEAALLAASIAIDGKDMPAALRNYQLVSEKGSTSDKRAKAYLSIADIQVQQGRDEDALLAYRRATEESSEYETGYRGEIGEARMLSKLGKHEAALALLDDLVGNTNYKEFFGEIGLEIGNTYAAMGDLVSAVAQYTYVDTTYARTEASAKSYYNLGMLYEDKLFMYDSARSAYNKGRNEAPSTPVTPLIVRRSEYMNKYHVYRTEIARYDTIRDLILNPPDTSKWVADSIAAVQNTAVEKSGIALKKEQTDSLKPRRPHIPTVPIDTVNARLAYNKTELASLFFGTIEKMDSAKAWYRRVLFEHPTSTFVPRAMFALAQIQSQDSSFSKASIDSMYREIIKQFPESEFAGEAKRRLGITPQPKASDETEASYAAAEHLMNQGKTSAAIDSFTALVKKYPESPLASRAQYSVGWLYEQTSHTDSAIQSYKKLVAMFPTSEYAALVKPKLAEVDLLKAASSTPDSLASETPHGPIKEGHVPEDEVKQKQPTTGDDDEIIRKRPKTPVAPPPNPEKP